MPAEVIVNRWTGPVGGVTKTNVTDEVTMFSTSDDPAPGNANPIPVPGEEETSRSYWATVRLSAVTSPSGTIDNIKWFSDGGNNFGPGISKVGAPADSYVEATGEEGVSGDELSQENHAGLAAEPIDVFAYTAASPLALSGSISNPDTGDFGQFLVAQLIAQYNVALEAGLTPAEQFVFQWDET